MSNTAETPTIIQPDVSANRATNLRKRLFTWFAEQRLHCIVFIAYVTVTVTVSPFRAFFELTATPPFSLLLGVVTE